MVSASARLQSVRRLSIRARPAFARRHLALIGVLGLYLALALAFRTIVPPNAAPDEQSHVDYFRFLAAERALPVQEIHRQKEASQPPLYYVVGTAWLIVGSVGSQVPIWDRPDDQPLYWHLRLVSIAFGVIAIGLFYRLGRLACPSDPIVAVGAAALGGLLPQFTFLSSVVNNDNAVNALTTLALVAIAGLLRRPAVGLLPVLMTGLAIGLAGLAKDGALVLLPFAVAAVAWRSRPWPVAAARAIALTVVVGVLVAPILLRNALVYGLPFTSQIMYATTPNVVQTEAFPSIWFVTTLPALSFASFWGAFGYTELQIPTFYPIFLGLAGLIGIGFVADIRGRWRRRDRADWAILTLLVGVALTFAGLLVLYNLRISSPQGRHVFPAIGAFAVLGAIGLVTFARRIARVRPAAVLGATTFCLVAGSVAGLALYAVEPPSSDAGHWVKPRPDEPALFRTPNDSAVYLLEGGVRRRVYGVPEFECHGFDWSAVQFVTPAVARGFPDGPAVELPADCIPNGTVVIDGQAWYEMVNGWLRRVPNATTIVCRDLPQRPRLHRLIGDLADRVGAPLAPVDACRPLPDRTVIASPNREGLFVTEGKQKRLIPSAIVYRCLGLHKQPILWLNVADFTAYMTGPAVTCPDEPE